MSTTQANSIREITNVSDPAILDQMIQEGDQLGFCKVIKLIAAGGMANVFKVWHEQLELVRAIKILKPGFNDETRVRLETEAKISANLRHGNIVEIYGMGYWNSIPYIEMEYVDGPSLKELLEKYTRFPIPFAISVCHFVCIALQYAYNRDMTLYGKVYDRLIHRDIKPANILISSQGKIKLADFGIARPSEVSLHTVGTKVMGTFAYLSPEQLNGEKLDQCSDVYSLGAVLYEMITGVKTFPQKLLAELIQKKSKGYFVPLESCGLQIPRILCNIVEKSLCLDKNRRYTNADDFDQELMSVLKRISNQSPEDIIRNFLKNPYSSNTITITNAKKNKKPFLFAFLCFLIFSISGLYFFYGNLNYKNNEVIEETNIDQKQTTKVDLTTPPSIEKKVPAQSIQPVATPKVQPLNDLNQSTFDKACRAFLKKDYNMTIDLLITLSPDNFSAKQKETMNLYLLQSYLNKNDLKNALNITLKTNSDNSEFHISRSELFARLKNYDEAINSLETASLYTSSPSLKKKIAFQKARVSEAKFMMKPNRDNKQLCYKAWVAFTDIACTDNNNSVECEEYQNKIISYSE